MKNTLIRTFPDPILRKQTQPVKEFDRLLTQVIDRMIRGMQKCSHSIGIAAPQVGISKAVAIVDISKRVADSKRIILVNPLILERKDPETRKEGCMSLPDYTAYLKRHRWVRYRYQDERGGIVERISEGLEAICVEHEVDHLNGVLFIDHLTCLRTDLFPRKA